MKEMFKNHHTSAVKLIREKLSTEITLYEKFIQSIALVEKHPP